jgi:hypothetical protein
VNFLVKVLAAVGAISIGAANAFAIPIAAEYTFNNSFASSVGTAPALTVIDPLGLSGFRTDNVFGVNRTVYDFSGNPNQQSGLALDVTTLMSDSNSYTVQMQFMFIQREGGYRRILDSQNRASDDGFYVGPGNTLVVYPFGGSTPFTNNVYHDVVLANDNGNVSWYLDGGAQNLQLTGAMDISAANMLNFFLDNTGGGGAGEYSSGSVALIRFFDRALTADQVGALPPVVIPDLDPTQVPAPVPLALLAPGLFALAAARRRRRNRG